MASIPTIVWLDREDRARLDAYARQCGEPVERVGGFLVEAELRRRNVPPASLPNLSRQTDAAHRAALDRLKADLPSGASGRDWRDGDHLT